MALIQCPECHKDVSEQAAFCPNCGWPPAGLAAKTGDSKVFGGVLVAMAAVGLALGLAVAVFAKTNNSGQVIISPVRVARPADIEGPAPSRPDDLKKISQLSALVASLEAKVAELEARPPVAAPPPAEEATLDSLIAANEAILETLGEVALGEAQDREKDQGKKKKSPNGQAARPAAFKATVIRIVEGDTLLARTPGREDLKIRLYGLAAPEGRPPGGAQARAALKLLKGRTVTVREMETDHYNRKVALIELDGRLVNVDLAAQGRAWYSGQDCRSQPVCGRIKAAESEARAARKGIWASADPAPPWVRPSLGK